MHFFFRIAYWSPVIAVVVATFKTPLAGLFGEWWHSPEQSQGLVIVPLALLVAWLRRRSLMAIPATCEIRGLVLTAAGCALRLFGELAAGIYVSQLSFALVLAGMIRTFWGIARLKALALPILLLVAAIPLPSLVHASLSMPLQLFVSRIACWLAEMVGVVVYREGNIIHLSSVSLGVWEACSGLNSLSALITGAVLLAFMVCRLPLTRALVCFAAIPIALLTNIARITGTAILSDSCPACAMNFYHAFSGWLVFLLGGIGLCGAAIVLRRAFDR